MTNLPHDNTAKINQEAADDGRGTPRRAKSIAVHFPAGLWRQLAAIFADTPELATELARLRALAAEARIDRANLVAAALATIAAHDDGEHNPLFYLRDELHAQGFIIYRDTC